MLMLALLMVVLYFVLYFSRMKLITVYRSNAYNMIIALEFYNIHKSLTFVDCCYGLWMDGCYVLSRLIFIILVH
jgi:hypothetical protein